MTVTIQKAQLTDLETKWEIAGKEIDDKQFQVISSTVDGTEYWMDETSIQACNHYLGLEIFRGTSSYGINVVIAGSETAASDTADTFGGLLVNKTKSEGIDGLKKMLDNLAASITNT